MTMDYHTAMRQAVETAGTYFDDCLRDLDYTAERKDKKVSDDTKFLCAALLSLACAIDYHTAESNGHIS